MEINVRNSTKTKKNNKISHLTQQNKKRTKIKIEHGKLIFGPQQKQQQNITSYPSLLLLQTRPPTQKKWKSSTHTNKHKLTDCTEE